MTSRSTGRHASTVSAPARCKTSASAREAAEWLLYEWPEDAIESPKARAARQTCLDALEGVGDTADARQAFRGGVGSRHFSSATWTASQAGQDCKA
jgi:hypothetical protein